MMLKFSFEIMAIFYLKVLEGFHDHNLWRKGITFSKHAYVLFSSHYVPNQLVKCFLKNFKNRNKEGKIKCVFWCVPSARDSMCKRGEGSFPILNGEKLWC